ncbi:MAG: type III-B CRISPR-associated protein Cas10/Cmr2 [Desulfotomaculales bacterium]
MPDAVLIFTFGPVQSFIAEARRTADFFAGSRILVELARAAGGVLEAEGRGRLVYPTVLGEDVPNKLVAVVPWEKVNSVAGATQAAFFDRWRRIADEARHELEPLGPPPDDVWRAIWERQTTNFWEVYWAAASLEGRTYAEAYGEAERVLAGAKRTRTFGPSEERGLKDSLSGRREALHTRDLDAKRYWAEVGRSRGVTGAVLRREGRERLDAVGAVKRFWPVARGQEFPSTSTVAAADFLERARGKLNPYRKAVEALLGKHLYRPRPKDPEWPYDGDLFYLETLTENRLRDSYGLEKPDPVLVERARTELRDLYKQVGASPTPYYGLLVLDGDGMGERIAACLEKDHPEEAHRRLSDSLLAFSDRVKDLAAMFGASLVYNGGDDVVALAPLSEVLPFARSLAEEFERTSQNNPVPGTASAGVAIAHHLYPLDAVVQAARRAEAKAKEVEGKAALCVTVLKRSGVMVTIRSRWEDFWPVFGDLANVFREDGPQKAALAGRFAYDVALAAEVLLEADEKFRAELKRLVARHRNPRHPDSPDPEEWTDRLHGWAQSLPEGPAELGRWLILARFIAQGGGEQ